MVRFEAFLLNSLSSALTKQRRGKTREMKYQGYKSNGPFREFISIKILFFREDFKFV